MTTFRTFLVSTTIAAMLAGGASAHSAHLRNTPDSAERADKAEMAPGMGRHDRKARGHDRMQMMRQMMRMHRAMMMGDAMPGMGMMTAPGMDMDMDMGMGMLGDMSGMGAMLPGLKADADGDGTVTPEELRERLAALLSEHDADGDGALSLDEFASLHAALLRETMVDRFQFLDDDGNGAVTAAEMQKPARMLERMQAMRERMMKFAPGKGPQATPGQDETMQGGMMQDGMMQDN